MIDWIKQFSNSDIGLVLGFISLVTWIAGVAKFTFIKTRRHILSFKGLYFVVFILALGLVIPITILVFSTWSGWAQILLNSLSIFALISFAWLIYIIQSMQSITKQGINVATQKEGAVIHLRATHHFFQEKLFIYLEGVEFYPHPIGYKVSAKIWSPDFDEITFKSKSVGFSATYKTTAAYRIRITAGGINEASFEVRKSV